MGLKYDLLINALRQYREGFGRGADAALAEAARIDPNIISRIIRGKTTKPSIETWDALYDAAPGHIPPPAFDREYGGIAERAHHKCPMIDECPLAKAGFFAHAKDDAMAPTLLRGDMVVVDPSAKPKNKRLCYVAGQPGKTEIPDMIRRYSRFGRTIVLAADNQGYDDIVVEDKKANREQVRLFAVTHRICKE